ncbi:hypothetical protein DICPUDRAFT_152678 [Dictyostelium purpureum]|uniref:Uncharacterized protein n=1 Tax=Dictyostelium purpureum TaxID=5786 RepID=F0ZM06_DICPU|nr:uncharacterized protein DICPUDRAFT_152678 [Dictyostelium purpureum]EGC35028.1 hypothetical protein DICPUDRAFT_152678 [Dictyostelium purpureum]|eukprot:XP_003288456.1 hypothetical protein DICPUDRAFT_152678 [Dictyostelium purpureum]
MSNVLEIFVDGTANGLSQLEALKNLAPNINILKFSDNPLSEDLNIENVIEGLVQEDTLVPGFKGDFGEDFKIPDQITEVYFELMSGLFSHNIFKNHPNLKVLDCGRNFGEQAIDSTTFPQSLEKLSFPVWGKFTQDCLPSGLKELSMESVPEGNLVTKEFFPAGLKKFIASGEFNQSLSILPRGIEYISLGYQFTTQILPGDIPSTCKYIDFTSEGRTNHSKTPLIPGSLPEGLKIVKFAQGFDQDLTDILPSTLVKLTIANEFTHQLKDLPQSIRILDFCFLKTLTQTFKAEDLPSSLKVFRLCHAQNITVEGFEVERNEFGTKQEDEEILNEKL